MPNRLTGWFRRGREGTEERDMGPFGLSGLNDPAIPVYQALVNIADGIQIGQGASGLAELPGVTLETSVRIVAVYRAVSVIAGSLSGLPVQLFDELGQKRKRVYPPENAAVWWQPNPEMDLPTFLKTSYAHNALGGNTYWYLVRDGLGQVVEIWPVAPNRVVVARDPATMRKIYQVDGHIGMMDAGYPDGEMVHIPNLSLDGLRGLNPIMFARMSMQLARATEEYGARVFANGSTPMGVISTSEDLTPDQADKLARNWEKYHRGLQNAHRVAVLDNNGKFEPISLSPQDSQFLHTRAMQVEEIGRLFGVPAHLLGNQDRSTSWGKGLEEQNRAMVAYTFSDYTNRFEAALTHRVIAKPGRYVKFDYSGLLKGAMLARFQSYSMAISAGWMSRNEARDLEDMEPGGPELDEFLQPLNMQPAGPAAEVPDAAALDDLQTQIDELQAQIDVGQE